MKTLAVLSLFGVLSMAHAAEQFGGVTLDSSVPENQVSVLKNDLKYVYTNPATVSDKEFLETTGLQAGTGEHLHNWIYNRIKYIVGEGFDLDKKLKVQPKLFFKYPQSPLPDLGGVSATHEVRTVMTNIGGALYIGGKKENLLIGLELDNEVVSIKSTRAGVVQVGEGLFYEGYRINKENVNAPSNSISRLGTLFHEARHSDGNGRSTGFIHQKCPAGHPYEGHAACETSGNGSYTVGALSERHMIKNCTKCSVEELTILTTLMADSFDRIFDVEKARERAAVKAELDSAKTTLEVYSNYYWPEIIRDRIEAENAALKVKIAELEKKLSSMSIKPDAKPASLDAAPEGNFKELSVDKSSKLMKASLK